MKVADQLLRSRMARRLLVLFSLCALIPISLNTWFSYRTTRERILEEAKQSQQQDNRHLAMAVYERLLLAEAEMEVYASTGRRVPRDPQFEDPLIRRFDWLREVPLTTFLAMLETNEDWSESQERTRARLLEDTTIFWVETGHPTARAYMARRVTAGGQVLTGELFRDYLWRDHFASEKDRAAFVLDAAGRLVAGDWAPELIPPRLAGGPRTTTFEWAADGSSHLFAAWSLPLRSRFLGGSLTFVSAADRGKLLGDAVSEYGLTFVPLALATLWLVLLLSTSQIRRSLVPLEALRVGTESIARGDLGTRVDIASRDEFQDIGHAFNSMASRLSDQFDALETLAEVDRAILSTLDLQTIARSVLGFVVPTPGASAALLLALDEVEPRARCYSALETDKDVVRAEELAVVDDLPQEIMTVRASQLPGGAAWWTAPLSAASPRWFHVVPILRDRLVIGLVAIAFTEEPQIADERASRLEQLSGQVAIALSKTRLLGQLEATTRGALVAFARSVDAKSRWTAGHSERVTRVAMLMGREMGLDAADMDRLEKGGLLHDIGKIGISGQILDKPSRLSDEEFAEMKKHPAIGARILEPIPVFADILPMVRSHHERWDGRGYPDGLGGEEIHPLARIMAVADVYDACRSDRPYRAGMTHDETTSILREQDGTAFEPGLIEVFDAVELQVAELYAPVIRLKAG